MNLTEVGLELSYAEALCLGQTIKVGGEINEDAFMVSVGDPIAEAGLLAGLISDSGIEVPEEKAQEYKNKGIEIIDNGNKVIIAQEKLAVVGNFAFLAFLQADEIKAWYEKSPVVNQADAMKLRLLTTMSAAALLNGFFED